VFYQPPETRGASTMEITTIGIDLAKLAFQIHCVDSAGKTVLRKQLRRDQLATFIVQLPPCLIGMEACGGAHFWARKFQEMGHRVRLMAPQFVKPYVKGNKNDRADAEAICEAVGRPNMRFVAIKNTEQQAVLALHRVRQGFVGARTAQGNQIRGLLAEFGQILPQGMQHLRQRLPDILEDASNELPSSFRRLIQRLLDHLIVLDEQVGQVNDQILAWHRSNPDSLRLEQVAGIGPITASAMVASLGDAKLFKCGREVGAWIGLVPAQHSSGGKERLLGISKRGDVYLRTLLIHGARSLIRQAQAHPERYAWLNALIGRSNANVAAVALANKNARIAWALLAHGTTFKANYRREPNPSECSSAIPDNR
jgi:transposase